MGGALALAGVALMIVGTVMVLRVIFRESLLWGLGSILVPVVFLLFVMTHWSEAKRGFLLLVAGIALFHLGGAMTPALTPP